MKKFLILMVMILTIILSLPLTSCSSTMPNTLGYSHYYVSENVTFVKIPGGEMNGEHITITPFDIYVHKETRVMYIWYGNGNATGMSVLLNRDGKPMIWEGDLE